MYTSFSVKNFRVFKDLAFDDLARVNLIAGMNNTGKTSLLEAIQLHAGDFNFVRLLRAVSPTYLADDRGNPARVWPDWATMFVDHDDRQTIEISGVFRGSAVYDYQYRLQVIADLADLSADEAEAVNAWLGLMARTTNGGSWMTAVRNQQLLRVTFTGRDETEIFYIVKAPGLLTTSARPPEFFPCRLLPADMHHVPRIDAQRFSEFDKTDELDMLVNILQVIEPRLRGLRLMYQGDPPEIAGDIGLRQPSMLSAMGEGLQRINTLILAMGAVRDGARNGVMLVDEIESGLHHSVQQALWKALYEAAKHFNVQLFATTHSYEMIRAAHLAFNEMGSDDFRLHRLDRRKQTGEIERVTYTRETLEAALDIALEVR